MASPDIYAAMDHAVAASLARARALMAILDQPHDTATFYSRMHAVRHELATLDELLPVVGIPTTTVPDLPPPAAPKGQQDQLPI